MKVLLWHVHGGWTDAFVRIGHEVLLPATPEGGAWGLGTGGRDWPATEIAPDAIRDADVDVVVLQRPEEVERVEALTGRRIGRDLPAVYLEHNTPKTGRVPDSRHPMADRDDVLIVHVTHVNALLWDTGTTRTTVIEHGIVDPGHRWTGALPRLATAINEPVRRWRVTGTDLLPAFAAVAPVDVFGMGTADIAAAFDGAADVHGRGDVRPPALHDELALRRAYVHPMRWTSLGLSLLEAMHLGMPVLALAMTEAPRAVPPEAGAISADVGELVAAARRLLADPDAAAAAGRVAREAALARYGLDRFLRDWSTVLADEVAQRPRSPRTAAVGLADTPIDVGGVP